MFVPDQFVSGVTYFVAPMAFLRDKSAAFGTNPTFDLMQVYTGGSTSPTSATSSSKVAVWPLPKTPAPIRRTGRGHRTRCRCPPGVGG
jgi:hypothetical protein